jgi:hypothetical protein
MAQAFKQRYKVDPSKVYQIVGACTAAVGVLIQLYFYEYATPCSTAPPAGTPMTVDHILNNLVPLYEFDDDEIIGERAANP